MPPLGLPERVQNLELALAQEQARRLAILVAIHAWLTSDPEATEPIAYNNLRDFLEERIAEG